MCEQRLLKTPKQTFYKTKQSIDFFSFKVEKSFKLSFLWIPIQNKLQHEQTTMTWNKIKSTTYQCLIFTICLSLICHTPAPLKAHEDLIENLLPLDGIDPFPSNSPESSKTVSYRQIDTWDSAATGNSSPSKSWQNASIRHRHCRET